MLLIENKYYYAKKIVNFWWTIFNYKYYLIDNFKNTFELIQTLSWTYGKDQDKGMAFRDGKSLHSRKLMWACRIRYVQSTYWLVGGNHLQKKKINCFLRLCTKRSLQSEFRSLSFYFWYIIIIRQFMILGSWLG